MPELVFKGKEFVYNHHLTVPFRPLITHPEKSLGEPRTDGNLVIHGDNLHALKSLLPLYEGQVDCIFIDPPYNTGNEGWSYNDNVNSPMLRDWLDKEVGLEDGLRHDKWACMMWPRLKLLHRLLSDTGSFWMTLDDNEIAHARCILDEIFGADNFVAVCIWQKVFSPKNTARHFSEDHDYVVVYAKKGANWQPNLLERTEEMEERYTNTDNDPRGPWTSGDLSARNYYSEGVYPITSPSGRVIPGPPPGTYWRMSKDKFDEVDRDGRIYWGEQGSNIPRLKRFLSEVKAGRVPQTLWTYKDVGHTQEAKKEVVSIFGGDRDVFITPKPVRLIERVLALATGPEALVLDSFAGSGTTAHAVLATNASDGGNRRFILVETEDYADTLTAERVRRVATGYSFTGNQREELFSEALTLTKLRNADVLLDRVQAIENLEAHRFDQIEKKVVDGLLTVTGLREVVDTAPGLGGEFTYCTLGDPVEMDALLTGASLPAVEAFAGLLFNTATSNVFDQRALVAHPEIGTGVSRVGIAAGVNYWLIYEPRLEFLRSGEAALTLARARAIASTSPNEKHVVFAAAKFVSRDLLIAEKVAVDFAPLPFALTRVEG